jgi:hypothetical protein
MNLGVGELRHLFIIPSRPISMTFSNNAFRTYGRPLVIAGVVCALLLCLLATGYSAAASSIGLSAVTDQEEQQAEQTQQEQAAGLHDPDRDRDRREKLGRAQLMLSPATSEIAPGDELSVRLLVVGAQGLLRLPATLHYDPLVVRVLSVRAGSAWEKGATPTLLYDTSRPGVLVVGLARLGREVSPITGGGELLRITFEAVAPGNTDLTLKRFALLGRRAQSQDVDARQAKVSVR